MRKLDQIVRETMIELGLESEHQYRRLYQIGVNGWREMHYDDIGEVKIVRLPVDTTMYTVDLPIDYINMVNIGIVDLNGVFRALGSEKNLALPRSVDDCGDDTITLQQNLNTGQAVSALSGGAFYFSGYHSDGLSENFRNGELIGRMYGIGGGNNMFGAYRIDQENSRIQLNSSFSYSTVVLEYIADPMAGDDEVKVHEFAADSIRCYILWRYSLAKTGTPLGLIDMRKRDFYNAKQKTQDRLVNSFNFDEALANARKHFQLAPKM